jgi:hypothetical protein
MGLQSGAGRPLVALSAAPSRTAVLDEKLKELLPLAANGASKGENALQTAATKIMSYVKG